MTGKLSDLVDGQEIDCCNLQHYIENRCTWCAECHHALARPTLDALALAQGRADDLTKQTEIAVRLLSMAKAKLALAEKVVEAAREVDHDGGCGTWRHGECGCSERSLFEAIAAYDKENA